ncbi:hypothetical protein Plhal703r1_c44g0145621 [Plasmopara halstedii]
MSCRRHACVMKQFPLITSSWLKQIKAVRTNQIRSTSAYAKIFILFFLSERDFISARMEVQERQASPHLTEIAQIEAVS